MAAGSLFGADLPAGFLHQDEFISTDEEAGLVQNIHNQVEFATFEMRGVIAKRRVAFFGASYDRGAQPSPPIPEFLSAISHRLAGFAGVAGDFAMVLINEYRTGTPIGWHRDAPQYAIIAGVSLLSSCRMRLRPYLSPSEAAATKTRRTATHEIELLPRSAYVMKGEARSGYEHSIPAVPRLRYSITFRTLR